MDSITLRKSFLEFFEKRGHTIKPSDSLVPSNDPTLLFTTAGMVQFKPLYAGAPLSFNRAASVQKCLRAGGKGSDLENVGKTIRHHTFFEMLGNFSFGDYFKKEAITWGWEYLTQVVKLDKERLWITIFQDDDEAFSIWKKYIGLSDERIVRLGEDDNFWGPAGDSGACGPSSEIHYDLGEQYGCQKESCEVGCGCERYLEIWNLVFPQFYQNEDGSRRPLERIGIDTGMGLERLSFVSQEVKNNYHTDLFKPVINELIKVTGIQYEDNAVSSFHVIADHVRALTYALAENILPSNEGRGYVIRRILRRGVRFGRKLNMTEAFIYKLVPIVVKIMKDPYPDLANQREHVMNIIKTEEERFQETLTTGLEILNEIIEDVKKKKSVMIAGDRVFQLYDTYGFPVDLVEEIAEEEELHIDMDGFHKKMSEQKKKARASWKGADHVDSNLNYMTVKNEKGETLFTGYETIHDTSLVVGIIKSNKLANTVSAGEECEIILDKTPFYSESGGQVGDTGKLFSSEFEFLVEETMQPLEGIITHIGKVHSGNIKIGDVLDAAVDPFTRTDIKRHHTATHLLQYVLRSVLGDHVRQAGSLVAPDHLRFDFSHFKGLSKVELDNVEKKVNQLILENLPVEVNVTRKDEAEKKDAIALFGEKYGEEVRIVDIGGRSLELCGGTHVSATGEIGLFKILSESSVASGIRRIEAVCGERSYEIISEDLDKLGKITSLLKVSNIDIVERIEKLLKDKKELEKELSRAKLQSSSINIDKVLDNAKDIRGIKVFSNEKKIYAEKIESLRNIGDIIKSRIDSGIIVLFSKYNDRPYMVVMLTKDLTKKGLNAKDVLNEIGKTIGLRGGGRPDLAQGGGKRGQNVDAAIIKTPEVISEILDHL